MGDLKEFDSGSADISMFDNEHDAELALLDALEGAIRDDRENGAVYEKLQQLVEHTRMHFLSEQLSMRRHAYPGYAAHREEHERLIAEIGRLQDSINGEHAIDPAELIAVLRRWLVVHMQTTDRVLQEYLTQSSTKSRAAGDI